MQATWNGAVLAESDQTIVVEGNHYFPPQAINREFFRENSKHTTCPWKGVASYYDVVVDEQVNPGGAWYYPAAKPAAKQIENYVAFWQGIRVEKSG
ncbi:MAG: DUF427 domain-containing protein [Anaerolineales bacterium]|nr:DUF427 domain-containing protein [Anaerolineales bacterium]